MQLQLKDLLSLANGASGFLALVFFFTYGYASAFALVVLALVFDYLDGKVARGKGSDNEFGKQIDSLCDAVSFGAVPAALVFFQNYPPVGFDFFLLLFAAVFFLTAVLVRLALFNLQKEQGFFIGLPSPPAAILLLLAGFVSYGASVMACFLLGGLMLSQFKIRKV